MSAVCYDLIEKPFRFSSAAEFLTKNERNQLFFYSRFGAVNSIALVALCIVDLKTNGGMIKERGHLPKVFSLYS